MCDVTHFFYQRPKHKTDIGSDVSLNRMQFCILTEDVTQSSPHTYIHMRVHQHTYTEIYIHSCKTMNSYIKASPPSTTDNGKIIFIHSGYSYNASLSPLLRGAPD